MAAMALPGAAHAQVAGEGASTTANAPIIVTARRRDEALQNAPVSVAVATSETIERLNLQDLTDIAQTTAGLTFDNEFGRDSNRPVIRGQANILGESGVATFIDGIYITGAISDYNVDDIERLEVVKGPQSALYGRNTYSGAINIVTRSPSDELGGRLSVDISEDDRYEITGYIEGGIAEGLTAGAQVRYYDFGGEHVNPNTGVTFGQEESLAFSGVIAYEPVGSPIRVRLRGYYSEVDDGQAALFSQDALANNCIFDTGSALYAGGGRYFCGTLESMPVTAEPERHFAAGNPAGTFIDQLNLSSRIEVDLTDDLMLVSLTGYNDRDTIMRTDGDYSPAAFQTAVFTTNGVRLAPPGPFPSPFGFAFSPTAVDFTFENMNDTHDISQELRLFYNGDDVRLLVGGYYFDQSSNSMDIREYPADAAAQVAAGFASALATQQARCSADPFCSAVVPFGPPTALGPLSRDTSETDIRNLAIFGSISYDITDELELSVEGRYASERIRRIATEQNAGGPVLNQVNARETYDSFDPRITLSYQYTPDNLLYAVFATGTKPGGFNGIAAINAGVPSFDQEDATSYEIGSKNVFGNGAFVFNVAAFYNEIDGYQLTQNVQNPNDNTTVSAVTNAGDAEILGIELEFIVRPNPNWTLTANYTWLDPEFTRGFDENEGVLNDVRDNGAVDCSIGDQFPDEPGCTSLFGSIAGNQIPRTSRHTIFADLDYRTDVGSDGWEFFAGANISHRSRAFAQVHNLIDGGETTLVNARIGIRNDNFRVQAYVNNLFNEDSTPLVLRYADANNAFRRNFVGALRRSRHFGVVASLGF
ncbi:TonB-dependent receptor [Parasphingopyxis sp.]|uniref:TonB-dependent receptor n=1 Tax=Parasphingopyxis sp. TaxID=1920299 RepID=UPI002628C073|nr:TonB-dependent receptor [Parasphingopyxis sp.]